MFHLASVSKPFVATATVSLAAARDAGEPVLDLDARISEWVPEFTLADGRAGEVTARRLLSHSSGLPDVADYGWHDPQLGAYALSEFARSLSGWRLQAEPGSAFSHSNAGFELLGLLLSRATGTTFENAMPQQVLTPPGMRNSTFLRGEVPGQLVASPHVGVPLSVPEGAHPYTRRHAPVRPCTPASSRCVAGWWPTSSRPRWLLGFRRAVGTAGRRAAQPDVAAGGAGG
jgi:CubicO group peptidase (beta-lactamase class C family)